MQAANRIVGIKRIGIVLGSAFGLLGGAVLADDPLSEATLGELRATYPGVEASWRDGYVRSVYGVPMGAGAETAEAAADDWLLTWGEVFGAEAFDYDIDWVTNADNMMVVRFDQVIDGVPVERGTGRVVVRQNDDATWSAVGAWCNAAPLAAEDLAPVIYGSGPAGIIARTHPDGVELTDWTEPELVVYANELLPRDDARLAWKILGTAGFMGLADTKYFFVDAETGGVLGIRSGIGAGTIDGTVTGYATSGLQPNTTSNPPTLVDLEEVTVAVDANNISDLTDDQGEYSLTANFSTPVTVAARLEGPTWEVQHPIVIATTSAPTVELTATGTSLPATVDFTFNSGSASAPISLEDTAIVNAHVLAQEATSHFTSVVNSFSLPEIPIWPWYDDDAIFPLGSCGGFYLSAGILIFFPPGSDPVGDCVAGCYRSFFGHEYAHAIADMTLGGEFQDEWAEGFADSLVVVMYNTGISAKISTDWATISELPELRVLHTPIAIQAPLIWAGSCCRASGMTSSRNWDTHTQELCTSVGRWFVIRSSDRVCRARRAHPRTNPQIRAQSLRFLLQTMTITTWPTERQTRSRFVTFSRVAGSPILPIALEHRKNHVEAKHVICKSRHDLCL